MSDIVFNTSAHGFEPMQRGLKTEPNQLKKFQDIPNFMVIGL